MSDAPVAEDLVEERHASWLELFFDLVAVAGIGMLAHLLARDASAGGIAVYVIAFTAFWLVWACFTTYGNVTGERARTTTILLGMAVLAVMTAAVPEIHGEHATAFAIAYVVGRFAASRPWHRGMVVVDLPVVQAAVGMVPWIVSFWFEGTTMYVLWAVGLVIDVVMLLTTTREEILTNSQAQLDRIRVQHTQRGRSHAAREGEDRRSTRRSAEADPDGRRPQRPEREIPDEITVAESDVPHLGERLGLFVLIVLGEGLVQAIDGASEAVWDRPLAVTGAGAFALIVGLWTLAVRRGYAGVALLPEQGLSPRLSWAAHLVATGAIATLAAVLGGLVAEPGGPVVDHDRWILVTAYAVFAALAVVVHLSVGLRMSDDARRAALRRALDVGAPLLVAAAVVAVAPQRSAEGVVWVLAGGVLWAVVLEARSRRTGLPGRAGRSRGRRPGSGSEPGKESRDVGVDRPGPEVGPTD